MSHEPTPRELMEFTRTLFENGFHVHVHHHHHYPPVQSPTVGERMILATLQRMGHTIMKEFDDLVAEVTEVENGQQAAKTLILGLHDQIEALGDSPTPEQLSALKDSLKAGADDLAAAVVANTPAAPEADPNAA